MSTNMKAARVVSATIYWPYLTRQNDDEKYAVTFGNLSEADVKKLEEMPTTHGLNVLNDESGWQPEEGELITKGRHINCTSAKFPLVKFFNPDRTQLTEEEVGKLGMGTKVRVSISSFDWAFKKKVGSSPQFVMAVVTEPVWYEAGEGEGGYEDTDDDLFQGADKLDDDIEDLFT